LMFQAQLPKEMWGEAVKTAAYLLNRSPTEATPGTTPIENWTGRKPDLSRLQIFGTDAYAKVLGYLKKLDVRSKRFIFVGYGTNGYRLWDPERRRIIRSRDVVFGNFLENGEVKADDEKEVDILEALFEDDEEEVFKPDVIGNNGNEVESQEENSGDSDDPDDQTSDSEQVFEDVSSSPQTSPRPSTSSAPITESRPKRETKLPQKFQDFAMLTYKQAINGPEKEKWQAAIKDEMDSLEKNGVWKLVDKEEAKGKKILTSKWIFRVKDDGRYKARLVARGFEQEEGIDYEETYSPVVNMPSLRALFSLAAKPQMKIKTFDVKTAFLYGKLEEEVYMQVPNGYDAQDQVLRLEKALYGLKQAPLQWNRRFTKALKRRGLIQLNTISHKMQDFQQKKQAHRCEVSFYQREDKGKPSKN